MNSDFEKLNSKYNDDTYDEFPYISKNRVTLLKKGLYRKYGAKYRGVTAVYNAETEEFTYPLYGMYRVPEDIIIVPATLKLNESKATFLRACIIAGYKRVETPPTFKPIFFPEDSPEARLALANKVAFWRGSRKDITI